MTMLLLEWVATSVFLILAVLALRAVFGKRVSARLRYALWAAVLVRLLVPVQLFTSPLAGTVLTLTERTERIVYTVPNSPSAVPSPAVTGPDPIQGGQVNPAGNVQNFPVISPPEAPTVPDAPQAPEAPDLNDLPGWLGWIWLAGGVVMALVLVASNLRFSRQLRRSRVALEGAEGPLPVYVAEGLPSPCLLGLFQPTVYVTPEGAADPGVLRHVLAHEYTHFRHGDHLWNALRCAALCLHWWNPLVWLAAAHSRRDGELACDEGALVRLGDGERLAYGRTLLALVTAKSAPGDLLRCATTMTGDKKSLKERLSRIVQAPKRWLWAAVAAALCLALACVCAFGQKAEPANMPDLAAELTFSLKFFDDGGPYVRMDGTVGGTKLPRGAFWEPKSMWRESSAGELSMVYPAFTGGIEGHVSAWWADEDRTSVTLSTRMTAMLSSLFNVGYWEFTVDLGNGVVTAMDGVARWDGLPDDETRFYPEAISDEEAVLAARVAAKLLTAGEDYYNSAAEPEESPAPTEAPSEYVPDEASSPEPLPTADPASMTGRPYHPDLNRNGAREELRTGQYRWSNDPDGDFTFSLGVWEDGELLWSNAGAYMPLGACDYLLVDLDSGEALLRLDFYGKDGYAYYSLTTFDLVGGEENVLAQTVFNFTYAPGTGSVRSVSENFDPEAIADFLSEANNALSGSAVLLDPLGLFVTQKERDTPRLDLSWLEYHALFQWDNRQSDLENLTRFKEAALIPQPIYVPSDHGIQEAREDLRAVLLGEQSFTFCSDDARVQIREMDINAARYVFSDSEYAKLEQFAVVDLDGDGALEAVVQVSDVTGDMGGYQVFHWAGPGDVRCYPSYWRNFWDLKTDGTFGYDYYVGNVGYASVSFPLPGYSLAFYRFIEGQYVDMGNEYEETYTVYGQNVTEEEYRAAVARQNAKEDAEWFAFEEENVRKVLG